MEQSERVRYLENMVNYDRIDEYKGKEKCGIYCFQLNLDNICKKYIVYTSDIRRKLTYFEKDIRAALELGSNAKEGLFYSTSLAFIRDILYYGADKFTIHIIEEHDCKDYEKLRSQIISKTRELRKKDCACYNLSPNYIGNKFQDLEVKHIEQMMKLNKDNGVTLKEIGSTIGKSTSWVSKLFEKYRAHKSNWEEYCNKSSVKSDRCVQDDLGILSKTFNVSAKSLKYSSNNTYYDYIPNIEYKKGDEFYIIEEDKAVKYTVNDVQCTVKINLDKSLGGCNLVLLNYLQKMKEDKILLTVEEYKEYIAQKELKQKELESKQKELENRQKEEQRKKNEEMYKALELLNSAEGKKFLETANYMLKDNKSMEVVTDEV